MDSGERFARSFVAAFNEIRARRPDSRNVLDDLFTTMERRWETIDAETSGTESGSDDHGKSRRAPRRRRAKAE